MNSQQRLLFGLLTSERLRGCCYAGFSESTAWSDYTFALEAAYASCTEQGEIACETIHRARATLEAHIPEGGEPFQAQVQASIVCLVESFNLAVDGDIDSCEAIIDAIVGALDNYMFFIRRAITGESMSPNDYELLKREVRRENDDLDFLEANHPFASEVIQLRRVYNLEYTVPVATGF